MTGITQQRLDFDELPELPDPETLIGIAQQRLDFYTVRLAEDQREIEAAEKYLRMMTGKGGRSRKIGGDADRQKPVKQEMYLRVLTALGNHDYARNKTVAAGARCSTSTAGYALHRGLEAGHVSRERIGHAFRYRLTEAGMEFVCGDAPADKQPEPEQ
jgi:hypothetical protein